MALDATKSQQKQHQIQEYLEFLSTFSKSTENYVYLLNFQEGSAWFFGGIEQVFALEGRSEEGCYPAMALLDITHSKDQPYLGKDIELLGAGEKEYHNMDYRLLTRNGEYSWVNCQGTVTRDEDGAPFFMVGRISQSALRYKVDTLTGLFNAESLTECLSKELDGTQQGYFLLLGIDNLKTINTRYGRLEGDKALKKMAMVLEQISEIPKIYRSGSDLFAVLFSGADAEQVRTFYERVKEAVSDTFTVSGGAVPLDLPNLDLGKLLQYAEFTLNKTKKAGKNDLTIFEWEAYQKEEASASLLGELSDSVKNGFEGFSLVYQPQIKAGGYQLFGAEALLRYESPTRGRVFPDEFIPILERNDLMAPVGLWVLETALARCKAWRKWFPDFHMSVNISYAQLEKPDIKQQVLDALERSGLPGSALTMEVTESMQLQNYPYYNEIFSAWKAVGIWVSVDDFGTGYSSLGYLKNLDIDEIKIDRCFVSGIQSSSYNYHLVRNMVDLAADSQIHVCCEGVEETKELQALEELKPNLLQGYLFSKPCDKDAFEKLFFDTETEEYQQYWERVGGFKGHRINELLDLKHREILCSVNMGLWMIRKPAGKTELELYIDETMRRLLGVERNMSPRENFCFWHERILPEYVAMLDTMIQRAVGSDKVVQAQYFWNHPTRGKIELLCGLRHTEDEEDAFCLQGYHRPMKDFE